MALSLAAMSTFNPPRAASFLGYAGLVPAAVLSLFVSAGPVDWQSAALHAHAVYAAVILSFIGGAWWGLAASKAAPDRLAALLAASVLPSLAGWALAVVGGGVAMIGIGLLFAAMLPVDIRLAHAGVAPSWWTRLRSPLSVGMALLAVTSGAMALAVPIN